MNVSGLFHSPVYHIDSPQGELTSGENIADQGGLRVLMLVHASAHHSDRSHQLLPGLEEAI